MEAQDYVKALLEAGLTQVEIAKKTGIPQPTISKVYRGDVADVLSRNYRKLRDLYEESTRPTRKRKAKAEPATQGA